eukprot:TRINITY_DN8126_c0_g1_i2.p1 TRINITY_DN8126_c0_g1~~TRINITY_DN8126_c0_g1_i2.p1  ORF type:complete len:266 (-),score=-9.17 TRINITY_DN8126_c0_g1_i2:105-902(-)
MKYVPLKICQILQHNCSYMQQALRSQNMRGTYKISKLDQQPVRQFTNIKIRSSKMLLNNLLNKKLFFIVSPSNIDYYHQRAHQTCSDYSQIQTFCTLFKHKFKQSYRACAQKKQNIGTTVFAYFRTAGTLWKHFCVSSTPSLFEPVLVRSQFAQVSLKRYTGADVSKTSLQHSNGDCLNLPTGLKYCVADSRQALRKNFCQLCNKQVYFTQFMLTRLTWSFGRKSQLTDDVKLRQQQQQQLQSKAVIWQKQPIDKKTQLLQQRKS